MGDLTTHAVKYCGYWYLAYEIGGGFIDSKDGLPICATQNAEAVVVLEPARC